MIVQPGLFRTWSETPKTGSLMTRLVLYRKKADYTERKQKLAYHITILVMNKIGCMLKYDSLITYEAFFLLCICVCLGVCVLYCLCNVWLSARCGKYTCPKVCLLPTASGNI